MWIGLLAALTASFLFGTVFVPIKRVQAGDGFTAQLFLCFGAFFVSTAVHAFQGFPPIHGFAMIGGILWAIANAFAIPIMNRLGMALAILVWNTTSCLTGWATSRYGLFGLPAAVPASLLLNYMGIVALIAGGLMYMFVKSNPKGRCDIPKDVEIIEGKIHPFYAQNGVKIVQHEISLLERVGSFIAALICGLFYGSMWIPVNYIKNHQEQFAYATPDSPPYLFSFYCGVMCASVFIFILYSLYRRSKPWINAEAALPSILAGAIFAVAMTSFVIAIDVLNASIAYPICAMAPGLVVSMWSILYFREITGRRNLILLAIAYGFTLLGVALMTISK
uniref:Transmembrane protein 144 n=2 Tax=Haemonchus contortus TaxID=6289 RepID=A0A7I4XRG7_HAECO